MKHLFDFDNGKILVNLDGQTAIDDKGNIFMRVSDDLAVDLRTENLHFTSGWDSDFLSDNG